MSSLIEKDSSKEYYQYHDYVFKRTVQRYANGVLKLLKIPFNVKKIIISEIADVGPKINRLDFVAEVEPNDIKEEQCLILECQKILPKKEDFERFFNYVSSLINLKKQKVTLYILCMDNPPYTERIFELNDETQYIIHLVSLKHLRATEIIKDINKKIDNRQLISEEDIASLQLIAYTSYDETALEILRESIELVSKIEIEKIEKEAILYVLDVISTNMLNEDDKQELMEEIQMLNPRDDYLIKKEALRIAKKLKSMGFDEKTIKEATKISEKDIQIVK